MTKELYLVTITTKDTAVWAEPLIAEQKPKH